jgi:ABC-2 type transport system ATP-binding protein
VHTSAETSGQPLRLAVRGLRVRLGDRDVLHGLDLSARRGEVVGLLGPNGSGKSTTFAVLLGLVRPTSGEVTLDGVRIAPGDRRLRARLGVVFQAASLDPKMTARENLRMAATLYGVPAPRARERIADLLDLVELRDRADEAVVRYSGGMKRRLELARALLSEPEILILDEPTTGLDERSFQRTWERILAMRERERITVILSTHRPEEAAMCDRVVIVDGGRVIAEGSPEELGRRVSGDVLTIEADEPDALARAITERFGVEARVVEGRVRVEREAGHELVPRLVEAFPDGRIRTLAMRRPTLADVFVKITGRSLGRDGEAAS